MPLDYLNEASDEIQRLFTRLDGVERTLRKASEERRPMIGEERYLTGEEVCTRLHTPAPLTAHPADAAGPTADFLYGTWQPPAALSRIGDSGSP